MSQLQTWYVEPTESSDGLGESISARALQQLASVGLLTPEDRVSLDGQRWVLAAKVRGLMFAPDPSEQVKTEAFMGPLVEPDAKPGEVCERIPGYEIHAELGAGTGGVVYKAMQKAIGRIVALKVVRLSAVLRETAVPRFEQEARILGKLQHPNIVNIFDYGRHADCVYMAMELLDGEDLERRIARLGRLDERTVWTIARQTASALAHAAESGIIHRDIKPANLVLLPTPTSATGSDAVAVVKVLDFGLAFALRSDDSNEHRITQAGSVVGTPAYMAPEQFASATVTSQADIYALGATVYHALSGQMPFEGPTIWDVMVQKSESAPRLQASVHPRTAKLVAQMMAPNAQHRIADYADLMRRIDELPCMQPAAPRRVLRTVQPTRTMRRVAVGASLIAALIIGIAVASSSDKLRFVASPAPVWAKTGQSELVSDRANQRSWPLEGSLANEFGADGEPVLTISGRIGWPILPTPADRFSIGLDLYRAGSADIVFAGATEPNESLVLRISRTQGVQLGITSATGLLTPLGPSVPMPSAESREGLVPYVSLELQRDGNRWDAWFENHHLGGVIVPATSLRPELQLRTDGRAVRVERVECLRKVQ